MNISNYSKIDKISKVLDKFKQFNISITAIIIIVTIILTSLIIVISQDFEQKAKKLVANDYPTLICKSHNGQFRIYEQGTYSVAKREKYGWNVWWTDKGYDSSTAFHITKCEIKEELK